MTSLTQSGYAASVVRIVTSLGGQATMSARNAENCVSGLIGLPSFHPKVTDVDIAQLTILDQAIHFFQ